MCGVRNTTVIAGFEDGAFGLVINRPSYNGMDDGRLMKAECLERSSDLGARAKVSVVKKMETHCPKQDRNQTCKSDGDGNRMARLEGAHCRYCEMDVQG